MELRDISMDDLPLWERLQCDPAMMEHLGGPQPREKMPQILKMNLELVEKGSAWVFKVMTDEDPECAAGSVCIWESSLNDQSINEIGWMILPEFQGKGLASRAVRALLDKARTENRWDVIHAFPPTTNTPSNALCRKLGFSLVEECDVDYAGRALHCNHWQIDLRSVPPTL
jgi:RimJ/RimL family protein N-acetyltransferase